MTAIDRHLTKICANGQSAQLSRTITQGTNVLFFQFWNERFAFVPTLPLIDAALDEAQRQVNKIRSPGCLAHYTPGGRQLMFAIMPQAAEPPPGEPSREDLQYLADWMNKHACLTTSTRTRSFL